MQCRVGCATPENENITQFWNTISPQIFSSSRGKTTLDVKKFLGYKNGADLLCHHARFGGAGSFHTFGGGQKRRFLSVSFSNDKVYEHQFAMKALEYRNEFRIVG